MAEENERKTYQCSRCKKKFFEDGFKINRLGRRLKTCLECSASKAAYRVVHKESLASYQRDYQTALRACKKNVVYLTDAEIDEILSDLPKSPSKQKAD